MPAKEYWVEILQNKKLLGAGFLLSPCYAVTALHCLKDIDRDGGRVKIVTVSQEIMDGRVHRYCQEADLALIRILQPSNSIRTPMPSKAGRREKWRSPYRPTLSDIELSGEVAAASILYRCAAGGVIDALQLSCTHAVGDYHGYSGSPVERDGPEDSEAVFGVLVDQHLDQGSAHRASGYLFAATVGEIYRRFEECFGADVFFGPPVPPVTDISSGPSNAGVAVDISHTAVDLNKSSGVTESRSASADPSLQLIQGVVKDPVLVTVTVVVPVHMLAALQKFLTGEIEGEA